jgi:deoxycytidine triphosphate deaminase
MRVLTDEDLRALIEGQGDPLVKPPPEIRDWFTRDSPVQPCSIDFHVGNIYVPGRPPDKAGSLIPIEDRFVLGSGQTVVIRTLETISLSSRLAGFGFPPSRVSGQGILMTNPGHIDPGYEGHLHLTAINMGREPFEVRKGDVIVTVVVVELAAPPKADFVARYGSSSPSHITQIQLDRLSPDFANVQERAKDVADKAVQTADLSIKKAQQRAALVGTIVTALLAVFTLYWNSQSKVDLLNQNEANLEKRIDEKLATNKRIADLERQVERLQTQIANSARDLGRR